MDTLRLRPSMFTFALALATSPALIACSSGDSTGAGASSSSTTGSSTGGSDTGGGGGTGGTGTGGTGGMGGAAPAITWKATAPMSAGRYEFTATRLKDGRVLVTGGKGMGGMVLDSTEIFDPKKGSWTAGPKLSAPRSNHAAVLMNDGTVAVIGGGDSNSMGLPSGLNSLATVDLFDPTSGEITPGPTLTTARGYHQAARLADGRVLVAGGTTTGGKDALEAEMLDAGHSGFTSAGTLTKGHSAFGLAVLTTGDVFVGGGISETAIEKSTERFDPKTNLWSPLPSMVSGRLFVSVAPLAKGGVLAAAGLGDDSSFLASSETLAAGGVGWMVGPSLPPSTTDAEGGTGLALIRLENGTVLGAGAYAGSPITQTYGPGSFSGVFDEASRKWTKISPLDTPRGIGQIVELTDHRVLLLGGIGVTNGPTETCSVTTAAVD